MATKAFIDQQAFKKLIAEIVNLSGHPYQDIDTIYRDMSRLVVVWIHRTSAADLRRTYKECGWEGSPNVRAIKACAKQWLSQNRVGALYSPVRRKVPTGRES